MNLDLLLCSSTKLSKVTGVTFKLNCTKHSQNISVSSSEAKCRNSNKLNRYPCFNRGKKGNNYLPIKEDETNGDRKKHLTYLGWKTKQDSSISKMVALIHINRDILLEQHSLKKYNLLLIVALLQFSSGIFRLTTAKQQIGRAHV